MQFLTAESQVIRWQIDSLFFHHLGNRQQLLHSCCKCSVVKCLCWSFEDALVFSMCEGTTYICFKFFEFHLVQLMSKIGMSHQPFIVLEATNMAFKMWLMHLANAVTTLTTIVEILGHGIALSCHKSCSCWFRCLENPPNYLLACVLRGLNHDWSSMMQLRGLVFEPVTFFQVTFTFTAGAPSGPTKSGWRRSSTRTRPKPKRPRTPRPTSVLTRWRFDPNVRLG